MKHTFKTSRVSGLRGEIRVAPDKSISHRALIFSALADGPSHIRNLLTGDDVKCTLTILRQLGIETSVDASGLTSLGEITVKGMGLYGLRPAVDVLYCGNSGTTMRLMLGLLSAQKFSSRLTGDASLNKRPMVRVMEPLSRMGAQFEVQENASGRVIVVHPAAKLTTLDFISPVASAQIKSCLLLAGLYANGVMRITEPGPSRDHSEIMLKAMGVRIQSQGMCVALEPGPLKPIDITVPGDISSAAFFMVAALITPRSDVIIRGIGLNPTRTGLLDVLIAMGGDITIEKQYHEGGEMVGDLRLKTSRLVNLDIGGELVPRLIDEIPILALAATQATGRMTLRDAAELRVKESDRIRAITTELARLGAAITETADGFVIEGGQKLKTPSSHFCSYGDHRMAMMEAVAGCILDNSTLIDDVDCVNTSFPGFFDLLQKLSE